MPLIKIYPVAEMGGVEYIQDLIKPMPFLNLLPCGFVKLNQIKSYLHVGAVAVGIGRELKNKNNYKDRVNNNKIFSTDINDRQIIRNKLNGNYAYNQTKDYNNM